MSLVKVSEDGIVSEDTLRGSVLVFVCGIVPEHILIFIYNLYLWFIMQSETGVPPIIIGW